MEKAQKIQDEFEFVAEIKQLLDIVINSLYSHPEIFVRELISNASDALHKIRFKKLIEPNIFDPDVDLRIDIKLDQKENTFSIEDTGIGMIKEEVIQQIGTIANSGTKQFLEAIKQNHNLTDINLIGKFGIGFYSVFMVTDFVTLETRSFLPDSPSLRWSSDGKGKYKIEQIEKTNRGTKVFFKLKDEFKEFSDTEKIKTLIKKYSNFIEFPIFVNGVRVNTVQAIWHKKKEELKEEEVFEFYKFLTNDPEPPIHYFQVNVEGNVSFKSLLFIPSNLPKYFLKDFFDKTIHLYTHKVFIQDDNQEILPDYLKFIRGVLDTEDLPLNISRETIQNNIVIAKIRQILTTRIFNQLTELAENKLNVYNKFYSAFSQIFKGGVVIDFENRNKIIELLRFKTSKTQEEELISLKDYVSRMLPQQKEIYYALTDKESPIDKNPNFEYFKKNNIEVLLLTDPVDVLIIPYINEYDGKPIKSIDKTDLSLPFDSKEQQEDIPNELINKLFDKIKSILGDKIINVQVSKRLVESPATLVSSAYSLDAKSEKILQVLDKDFKKSAKILEININHNITRNLIELMQRNPEDPNIDLVVNQIFESALLLDGELDNPKDFVTRLNHILSDFTESKIKRN